MAEPLASDRTNDLPLPHHRNARWRRHGCGVQSGRQQAEPQRSAEISAGGSGECSGTWSASGAKRPPHRQSTIPTFARFTRSMTSKGGRFIAMELLEGRSERLIFRKRIVDSPMRGSEFFETTVNLRSDEIQDSITRTNGRSLPIKPTGKVIVVELRPPQTDRDPSP
jgi:hypothetical protein